MRIKAYTHFVAGFITLVLTACTTEPKGDNLVPSLGDTTVVIGKDTSLVEDPDTSPTQNPDTNTQAKPGTGVVASGLPIFTWAEIEAKYAGSFALPAISGEIGKDPNFTYSSGNHAQLANGHLLVVAHPYLSTQAEIILPAKLDGSVARLTGAWSDITGGLMPKNWKGGEAYGLGGLLEIDNRIYFTKNQWYNGDGYDWPSLGYSENGAAKGMWLVKGNWVHNQRVGGYMSYAPKALVDAGYGFLAGLEGTSGAANGRWGPNLFAIQTDFPGGTDQALNARALLAHPDEGKQFPGWWIGDKVSSVVWIETAKKQAVLVFLYQQLGDVTWYGEATQKPGDPYPGYKGFHASGYQLQVWIYHPKDLIEVFNGKRNPWSVTPVEKTVLIARPPGSAKETRHSFLEGPALMELEASYRDGRLILMQPNAVPVNEYEQVPKGYVLQLE